MNPYKLHSPSTLVGNEQDRPANPWRYDAKHVSPHLIWQINPPQRASQKRRRKPSVSVMTSALLFSRGWHLPFVGGTFHSPTSELPTCPSFPRRREASQHTHSPGFPPARERLTGVAHGAGMAHAAIYNGHLCLAGTYLDLCLAPTLLCLAGTYLDLCLAPTLPYLICAWHLPCYLALLCVPPFAFLLGHSYRDRFSFKHVVRTRSCRPVVGKLALI